MHKEPRRGAWLLAVLVVVVSFSVLCNKAHAFSLGVVPAGICSPRITSSVSRARPRVAVKGFLGDQYANSDRERHQAQVFELNRGKAVLTLIKDYQDFRDARDMDFSIFSEKVTLVDTQVRFALTFFA